MLYWLSSYCCCDYYDYCI